MYLVLGTRLRPAFPVGDTITDTSCLVSLLCIGEQTLFGKKMLGKAMGSVLSAVQFRADHSCLSDPLASDALRSGLSRWPSAEEVLALNPLASGNSQMWAPIEVSETSISVHEKPLHLLGEDWFVLQSRADTGKTALVNSSHLTESANQRSLIACTGSSKLMSMHVAAMTDWMKQQIFRVSANKKGKPARKQGKDAQAAAEQEPAEEEPEEEEPTYQKSAYEKQREANMARNEAILRDLGLGHGQDSFLQKAQQAKAQRLKRKRQKMHITNPEGAKRRSSRSSVVQATASTDALADLIYKCTQVKVTNREGVRVVLEAENGRQKVVLTWAAALQARVRA